MKILQTFILFFFTGFCAMAQQESTVSLVNWLTFEQAVELNKKSPRKIFVDVYTDWCGWCKVMDKSTFSNQEIADYLNSKFYPVKLNAEMKDTVYYAGKAFTWIPYGTRGFHELAASLLNGKLSYPTVVFLDEQLNMLSPVPGYQNPQSFDALMRFYGENFFRTVELEDFKESYKSIIPR